MSTDFRTQTSLADIDEGFSLIMDSQPSTSYGSLSAGKNEVPRPRRTFSLSEAEGLCITMTWEHLNVYAPLKRKGPPCKKSPQGFKHILKDVSGIVEPGSLLAVMGASGAGKSTLMNALTYRNNTRLVIGGEVKINGANIGTDVRHLSAYVQQDEMFIKTLGVKEHLVFQALLRMDGKIPTSAKLNRVDELLTELGLNKCAGTIIGEAGSHGISGGERRRLSFASELITNPPLLFCDEPTSGLDSYMAQNIVTTLKELTSKGKAILCTIHQPSSEVFTLFDKVLFLAEGKTAFLGSRDECLKFFSKLDRYCPDDFNPADYYIGELAVIPGKEKESNEFIDIAASAFEKSQSSAEVKAAIKNSSKAKDQIQKFKADIAKRPSYKTSWLTQFAANFRRCILGDVRVPALLAMRLGRRVVLAIVIGLIFLNQSLDQKGVMNLNGAMFNIGAEMTFTTAFQVLPALPFAADLFFREYESGMLRSTVFYATKTIVQAAYLVVEVILYVTITYWMTGLEREAVKFFWALLIYGMIAQTSMACGFMVGCASPNQTIATAVFAPLNLPLVMLSGFFMNIDTIPVYISWLQWISWLRYGIECVWVNQWKDVEHIGASEGELWHYKNGTDVLNSYNFKEENFARNMGLMAVLMFSFHMIAYIVLFIRARNRMKSNTATVEEAGIEDSNVNAHHAAMPAGVNENPEDKKDSQMNSTSSTGSATRIGPGPSTIKEDVITEF